MTLRRHARTLRGRRNRCMRSTQTGVLASHSRSLVLLCKPKDQDLAPPVVEGRWVRPAASGQAQPIWEHADGLRVGLHPLRGLRGMLRNYTPYPHLSENHLINFIAVEPITSKQNGRGLSELELSQLDRVPRKRFWSGDKVDTFAGDPQRPARGWIEHDNGIEILRVYIFIERFDNGTHVYLRKTFTIAYTAAMTERTPKYLRIAWSVVWGTMAVLLVVLWARSYLWWDRFYTPISPLRYVIERAQSRAIFVESASGRVTVNCPDSIG